MPPDVLAGVTLTVIGHLLLLLTGVNGIRHARLMRLGADGYAMASIWLWIAFSGSLNLAATLSLINAYGMPTAILFASGHSEPFSFGLRNWLVLSVGFAIVFGLCFRSFVMVRNAKLMSLAQREEAMRLQKAILQVRRTRNG